MKPLSLAYWALIGLTCPLFFVGALLVFLVTLPFDRRRVALHLYSCAWASFYIAINPIWRLRVRGREHLPWRSPAVLVANHASLVDILVLFELFRPFKWISKASIFRVPFVGWNMRLNDYVPIVRGDRASVLAMHEHCRRHLRRGSPVLFFPEGTRTKDGALQPFKDGAFELAVEFGVPVVPIALTGTGRALPKHGFVLREHIDATVQVLEPIAVAPGATVGEVRDAARAAIAAELSRRA